MEYSEWKPDLTEEQREYIHKLEDKVRRQLERKMEPELYYLVGLRQGAWMTKTGQYSTDRKQARQVSWDEAIDLCRRHKAASNILVPVLVADMELIG